MKKTILLLSFLIFKSLITFGQTKTPIIDYSKDSIVELTTDLGKITLRLYNETPLHRDNFMKLVRKHYFDSLLFHRVIKDFMIQGGDPDSKRAKPDQMLGNGGPGYTIPAEIRTGLYHKKGVLSAARLGDDINPNKESSGSQFYIVQGRVFSENDLKATEDGMNNQRKRALYNVYLSKPENLALREKVIKYQKENKLDSLNMINGIAINYVESEFAKEVPFKFSPEQLKDYTTIGGAPHLDGGYTVFGEVIEGLDVIDKIAAVEKNASDRPKIDVRMFMKAPSKAKNKKK